MSNAKPLGLLESADLLGRYRYVELALFGLCGGRLLELAHGERRWCSGAARAHAWRAGLFEALLPVSVGLPDAVAVTRPSDGAAPLLARLGSVAADRFVDALVRACYPAMVDAYTARLAAASFSADPPLFRTLRRAVSDLESLIADAPLEAGSPADPIGQELRALFAGGEGLFGPLSRGDGSQGETRRLP